MGCFSTQSEHRRRTILATSTTTRTTTISHPSKKSFADLRQAFRFPSSSRSSNSTKIHNYGNSNKDVSSTPSFRAKAAMQNASVKLVKNQPRPALVSISTSAKNQSKSLKPNDVDDPTTIVKDKAEASENGNGSNGALFPLPPPPTIAEDVNSQSVSSTSSSATSSSSSLLSDTKLQKSSSNRVLSSPTVADSSSTLQALPLPPPPDSGAVLREFSYDELAGACLNFATEFFIRDGGAGHVFRAVVKNTEDERETMEVDVTRLNCRPLNSIRKWRLEVGMLFRLSHPHLCKVVGFAGDDAQKPCDTPSRYQRDRLLVYEHMPNGGLDKLLYCRQDKAPLDWSTRLQIALGAAQGLAYLHDRSPRQQILYKSFKTVNIQIDQSFNAKLSDYGFSRSSKELPSASPARFSPLDDIYAAPETRASGDLSTKSNVWSFAVVLLELITGRQNMDDMFPREEQSLPQWCRPHLLNFKKLYLIMDPELKGRYPTKSAEMMADLILQCLSNDPTARPDMRDVSLTLSACIYACNMTDNKNASSKQGINGYNRKIGYATKFKLSKSHSLASVLASPARTFVGGPKPQDNANQGTRMKFRAFLNGEISGKASSMKTNNSFIARSGAKDDIGVQIGCSIRSPITRDFIPLPRSVAKSLLSG